MVLLNNRSSEFTIEAIAKSFQQPVQRFLKTYCVWERLHSDMIKTALPLKHFKRSFTE